MRLELKPLTAEAFAPFGDVIEVPSRINSDAPIIRHNALSSVDLDADGTAIISLMVVRRAVALPYVLPFLERHPFGSQAFYPTGHGRFIVAVAPGDTTPDVASARAFLTNGRQGVSIKRALWHGPLASLDEAVFVVIDRHGPGDNGQVFRDIDMVVVAKE